LNPFSLLLLGFFLVAPTPAHAQTVSAPVAYSTTTAPLFIEAAAKKYGIDPVPLEKTLYCESGYDANAVNPHDSHGGSFGVAQINASHTDITRAQMLNPLWSIDWAAKQFSEGHQSMWSCYKMVIQ
jgi:soluble lytic murein transglycosylase-like protein